MPDYASDVSRYGWALIARGVVLFLFGLAAFAVPGITLVGLIFVFAAFVVASGILALGRGLTGIVASGRGWTASLIGLLGLIVGIRMFASPGVTLIMVLWAIGIWAIVSGIMEIVAGFRLRRQIEGEWRMILSGLLSALFGVLLIWSPVLGGLAIAWTIGAASIAYGVGDVILGINLRRVSPAAGTVWREEDRRAA
jgi:uncharacterized membrane protein HdeD (DUF308 family)